MAWKLMERPLRLIRCFLRGPHLSDKSSPGLFLTSLPSFAGRHPMRMSVGSFRRVENNSLVVKVYLRLKGCWVMTGVSEMAARGSGKVGGAFYPDQMVLIRDTRWCYQSTLSPEPFPSMHQSLEHVTWAGRRKESKRTLESEVTKWYFYLSCS